MNADERTRARRTQTGRRASIGAVAFAAAAAWFASPWLERTLFVTEFAFKALEEPAGFRRIDAGDFSGGLDPLTGVTGTTDEVGHQQSDPESGELCRALFGVETLPAGVVPIAYFTDYLCPYCRVLSKRLSALRDEQPEKVQIAWHEWPVFGKPSELAARAALAARRQGAYAAFHERLIRTSFVPTPAYLRSISEEIGIDLDRLLEDMESPEVEREIGAARALAATFGFPGTPGLVVGRTVVVGAIDDAELRALIEREIADGPIKACRSD